MPKASKTKKKSPSVQQKRRTILDKIRHGDIGKIAELSGYERSHVGRVIKGERNNPVIVDTAYAMLNKRKVNS